MDSLICSLIMKNARSLIKFHLDSNQVDFIDTHSIQRNAMPCTNAFNSLYLRHLHIFRLLIMLIWVLNSCCSSLIFVLRCAFYKFQFALHILPKQNITRSSIRSHDIPFEQRNDHIKREHNARFCI